MSQMLASRVFLAILAMVFCDPAAAVDAPEVLLGTWLPLDGFARLQTRPTCIGGDRADGTQALHEDGEWSQRGGGDAQACIFESFRSKSKNRWTSIGACSIGMATEVRYDWILSRDGSRLHTIAKYEGGRAYETHYRRCTIAEKIAGIGLPVGDDDPDDLERTGFALGYAKAAIELCPQFIYDEHRAAGVAREAEAFTADQINSVKRGADIRPIPEIVRERLYSPRSDAELGMLDDKTQITDRNLYCAELLTRFGKDGTLIRGLLREKFSPL